MNRILLSVAQVCVFLGALLGGNLAAAQQASDHQLVVHWVNLQPEDGLIVDAVVVIFHDGSFDLYDSGRAASPLLEKLVKRQFDSLQSLAPEMRVMLLHGPHEPSPIGGGFANYSSIAHVSLDAQQHRYATAYIALRPSNDAFLGNEDGYRIELFDLAGNAEMPLVIDFNGSEVMDAGVCFNDEARLHFLDVTSMAAQTCRAEGGVVRRHPGFNGSVGNPGATPKRILGGTSVDMGGVSGVRRYDPQHADFSRAGAKIGRLVFMTDASVPSSSGSWYDPARSGEGFNIEIFRPAGSQEDHAMVYWYTYEPGTGKPLWLVGSGPAESDIPLYSTSGGRLGATTNPDTVVSRYWGKLRMSDPMSGYMEWCNDYLQLYYSPEDPSIPSARYPVRRLTPQPEAVQTLCRQLYPATRRVY